MQAQGFRVSFTLLLEVLFTFPSQYSFTIGLTGVFSLAGWSRRIRAGFLVSRATQDAAMPARASGTGLSPPAVRLSSRFPPPLPCNPAVLQPPPCVATRRVWAPPRSLAATGGIIVLFSFPPGTKMFQFPGLAPPCRRCPSFRRAGCPIRKSADQRPFAPTRGLSQLVTSFVASVSQGIRPAPFSAFCRSRKSPHLKVRG